MTPATDRTDSHEGDIGGYGAQPYVSMTKAEAAQLSHALEQARARLRGLIANASLNRMASASYRAGEVAELTGQLHTLDAFHNAHELAHGLRVTVNVRAPWPDFAGNPIHEGDTLRHPDGTTGTVKFVPWGPTGRTFAADRWYVDYGTKPWSRLSLQIGDKGQAVVIGSPAKRGMTAS